MNCSKIGQSYEAFTYLIGRNIFISLISANKNSLVEIWKISSHGKFGLMLVKSQIYLNLENRRCNEKYHLAYLFGSENAVLLFYL